MNKKQLLLNYLDTHLFIPVISSPNISYQLKGNMEHTRQLMDKFSAEGIICYVWNMFANDEVKMIISNRLLDEGFQNYPQIMTTFKQEFTYDWLMS